MDAASWLTVLLNVAGASSSMATLLKKEKNLDKQDVQLALNILLLEELKSQNAVLRIIHDRQLELLKGQTELIRAVRRKW